MILHKLSLLDAACFDFAPQAYSDEEANVLYSAKDAGVLDEICNSAHTWLF